MFRNLLLAVSLSLASLATSGCTALTEGPGTIAGSTLLDEKGAIGAETFYTAVSTAAAISIRTGTIRDRATIARIGELDAKAYAAVLATRSAYRAGNAASYAAAFAEAATATKAILSLF